MKRKKNSASSILRSAATAIVDIILLVTMLLSIILTLAKFTIFDYGFYKRIILTDDYYTEIKKEIEADIDDQGVSRIFTEITDEDKQVLKDSISYDTDEENSVRNYSETFLKSIVSHIKSGTEISSVDYRNEKFRAGISGIINSFAESVELSDTKEIEESVNTAYDELRQRISTQIQIINIDYWNKLPSLPALSRAADVFYIPIILTAVAAFVIRFIYFKKKTIAYYYMVFPMWFASLIIFVPSMMLSIYDIPKKIRASVLATSSPIVNLYIGNFVTNFVHLILTVSLILFALLTILLLMAILTNANHHGNHYVKQRRHRHSSSSGTKNDGLVI